MVGGLRTDGLGSLFLCRCASVWTRQLHPSAIRSQESIHWALGWKRLDPVPLRLSEARQRLTLPRFRSPCSPGGIMLFGAQSGSCRQRILVRLRTLPEGDACHAVAVPGAENADGGPEAIDALRGCPSHQGEPPAMAGPAADPDTGLPRRPRRRPVPDPPQRPSALALEAGDHGNLCPVNPRFAVGRRPTAPERPAEL